MMIKIKWPLNRLYRRLGQIIGFTIITSTLLLTPYQHTSVSATSYYLFHPGFGTPIIDGNVEFSEWAAADTYTQAMVGSNTGLTGTLYVLQDKENLYLGFIIDDDELTIGNWYGILGDTLEINFDDNNSGSLYEVGENKVVIDAVRPYLDKYYDSTSGSTQDDAQQDGQGYLARQGNDNHFELAFPLCSGDADDFCLTDGSILGLQIQYNDYDTNTTVPSPPPDGSRLPGSEADELVTIEIQSVYNVFLPLIRH
jgi:hypothetical protein